MDKKVLRWNFVFQYGWVITNIINSILLLPLYVKHIDASTLGVWLATSSILYWMTIVDPGIGEVLQQKIAELKGKHENDEIGRSIGSGLICSLFILLLATGVGVACYYFLGFVINKDISRYPNLSTALFITILSTGMSLVSFTLTGINQGLHNSAQVAISSLTANLLFLIINLVFLQLEYGVISIAIANLARALYINAYNLVSLKKVLNRTSLSVSFSKKHFKGFIRIFSFTSASKVITGIANSIDMLVLARFISPALITTYEINKRPINLTNSLIGRHSVALMPLISHTKGKGEKKPNVDLINRQFKFYLYAALFTAFMFAINYSNLINLWVGENQFVGNGLLSLMLIYSFFYLLGYFMSNVGYALGDIKRNSTYLIIRNIIYIVLVFFGAKYYGMAGTLSVSVGMAFLGDFFFFNFRVYRMGYLKPEIIKNALSTIFSFVPCCLVIAWLLHHYINEWIPEKLLLTKMIVSSGVFVLMYALLVLLTDATSRQLVKQLMTRLRLSFT